MAAGRRSFEGADDVRHFVMRGDDAVRETLLIQELGDECGNLAGVPRRIWAFVPNERLEKLDELVAVALDPIQKLLTFRAHNTLPVPAPCARHYRSFHRPCKYD
jgi:hypothetical protein